MKLYAYNQGSASAKALSEALNIKRIKHEGKPLKVDVLINWGASVIKRAIIGARVLNAPEAIQRASDKLRSFRNWNEHELSIPKWTEQKGKAAQWIEEGSTVVCRTKLNGHSGEGIVIAETLDQLVDAPLYTLYIPKKHEYRLHVFGDKVFFIQRKARNKEVPDNEVDWQVRNHSNGFIFAFKDVDVPDVAKAEAIKAVKVLGLDFGAVDLIWNEKQNKYYVLEVNTACGLEGTTLEKYVEQFKEIV